MKTRLNYLLALLVAATMLAACGETQKGKSKQNKKIEVTGSAEMEVVPDEIFMTFTLKEYLDNAKQKVNIESIKTDFLVLCKNAGIADSNISIANYSGNERWDYYWYRRRKSEPEFMSSISYSIKVNAPEKLDPIVAGINDNAMENFYISKTSHSNMEALRKEVKMKALKASKEKADYLAKSIGEELGEAIRIQEVDESNSPYTNIRGFFAAAESNAAMDQQSAPATPAFEKIKIRYEMKAAFKLK
jgi:uncharacterized protein